MDCPYCGGSSRVIDSRPMSDGVRRRRECTVCGRRFTTHEKLAPADVRVLKLTGKSEEFRRDKLVRAIRRVARGTVVPRERVDEVARRVEAELIERGDGTIESFDLVLLLLPHLEALHPLVHRRFLSNYTDSTGTLVRPRQHPPEGEEREAQLGLFAAAGAE